MTSQWNPTFYPHQQGGEEGEYTGSSIVVASSLPMLEQEAGGSGGQQSTEAKACGVGLSVTIEYSGDLKGKGGPHDLGAKKGDIAKDLGKQKQAFKIPAPGYDVTTTWNVDAWVSDATVCYLEVVGKLTKSKYTVTYPLGTAKGEVPDQTLTFKFGDSKCNKLVCEERLSLPGQKYVHKPSYGILTIKIELEMDVEIQVKGYTTSGVLTCPAHGLPYPHEGSEFRECFWPEIQKVLEEARKRYHEPRYREGQRYMEEQRRRTRTGVPSVDMRQMHFDSNLQYQLQLAEYQSRLAQYNQELGAFYAQQLAAAQAQLPRAALAGPSLATIEGVSPVQTYVDPRSLSQIRPSWPAVSAHRIGSTSFGLGPGSLQT